MRQMRQNEKFNITKTPQTLVNTGFSECTTFVPLFQKNETKNETRPHHHTVATKSVPLFQKKVRQMRQPLNPCKYWLFSIFYENVPFFCPTFKIKNETFFMYKYSKITNIYTFNILQYTEHQFEYNITKYEHQFE